MLFEWLSFFLLYETNPVTAGAISGALLLVFAELVRAGIQQMRKAIFSDEQRRYIDDRIVHKLNNDRIVSDGKYVHKPTPQL